MSSYGTGQKGFRKGQGAADGGKALSRETGGVDERDYGSQDDFGAVGDSEMDANPLGYGKTETFRFPSGEGESIEKDGSLSDAMHGLGHGGGGEMMEAESQRFGPKSPEWNSERHSVPKAGTKRNSANPPRPGPTEFRSGKPRFTKGEK